jgi:hypothetical protein
MKIRIEIPDDVFHRAQSEAASSGRKLSDLVEEGLRLVLKAHRVPPSQSLADLMKDACGVVIPVSRT